MIYLHTFIPFSTCMYKNETCRPKAFVKCVARKFAISVTIKMVGNYNGFSTIHTDDLEVYKFLFQINHTFTKANQLQSLLRYQKCQYCFYAGK